MQKLHNRIFTISKIFGLHSAKSEHKLKKLIIMYNVILILAYVIILRFRFDDVDSTSLETVNKTMLNLRLAVYAALFLANILSNWLYSKKIQKYFKRLLLFDENLTNYGFVLNINKIKKYFHVSFAASILFFLYVAVFDCVYDVIIEENVSFAHWFSLFIPFLSCYYSCFFMVVTLCLLRVRYSLLVSFLNKILTAKSLIYMNMENLTVVKAYANCFITLNKIVKSLISKFSLQICSLFLITSATLTNNLYLLVKEEFEFPEHLLLYNLFIMKLTEIVAVVLAHYQIQLKINIIKNLAPHLTRLNCGVNKHRPIQLMECYLLIDRSDVCVQVFGMFTVDPSNLFVIGTWMISYLVIMV
ncbi:hypothetical protein Zmor_011379 [Zophobas morio]|uniref:Gustatory receptor n=1 Tax=Zophobas morio TaxID=2755281 RepID=A0AA38MJF3_9CUCU|nr:hypothetical protein Zmor_011379 [Zophobas morio]